MTSEGDSSVTSIPPKDFCCPIKRYLSTGLNIVDTLAITPRAIVYKKNLKVFKVYEETISIKNNGLYPRKLVFRTDNPQDTDIKVSAADTERYLGPDEIFSVRIVVNPLLKANINRTRRVYIESEHPSVAIEVPIFVMNDEGTPIFPEFIEFPASVPKTKTFYEFLIYNTSAEPVTITLKSLAPAVTFTMSDTTIRKKYFIKVLLTLRVNEFKVWRSQMKLKYQNKFTTLDLEHTPIPLRVYMNVSYLTFEELKFGREARQEFTICNETNTILNFVAKFTTEDNVESSVISGNSSENEVLLDEQLSRHSYEDFQSAVESFHKHGHLHYAVEPKEGKLYANLCTRFTLFFRPDMNADEFDEDLEPPFQMNTKLIFTSTQIDRTDEKSLLIRGLIHGPDFEFYPSVIDVRKVYLGEEHCEIIKALNVDGLIRAKVFYKEHTCGQKTNITITPEEGFELNPCENASFHMKLFTTVAGKFSVKLKFKVKNGATFNVLIRGLSQSVRVRIFPEVVEMGVVPFAVPLKRYVLLMNPLSVPITLRLNASEDGCDTPLVLDIRDTESLPPITLRNPIREYCDIIQEKEDISLAAVVQSSLGEEESFRSMDQRSMTLSYHSHETESSSDSSFSAEFEDTVLNPIESMAKDFIYSISKKRYSEKNEVEKVITEEAIQTLIKLPYFAEMACSHNFAFMDWNLIPSDPKELYYDSEVIYLKPSTGRKVTIMVIPNVTGFRTRSIDIRICPINEEYLCDHDVPKVVVPTKESMICKIFIEYNCRVPDVIWDNHITFEQGDVYAGQEVPFDMEFQNNSNVGGFIHFDVVPDSPNGVMYFRDLIWKFVIVPHGFAYAYCAVVFRKFGFVELNGILKFVGLQIGSPFSISSNVMPTRIRVTPKVVYHRQPSLTKSKVYVFIENLTPTITPFFLHLKNDNFQYIEPKGAILGPNGHSMYVTIHTFYYDPEIYKNVLYIDMPYGNSIAVPMTFNIEGMPIFFEPNIKEGFQSGCILTTTKENFLRDIPNYSKTIKVINRGKRTYRISINFMKTLRTTSCSAETPKGRMNVGPMALQLGPGSEGELYMQACGYEDVYMENEYTIRIVDQMNKQRVQNILFLASIRFCEPKFIWSKREVKMEYRRTHIFKDHSQIVVVELISCTETCVDPVHLKVIGPFKIKSRFEDKFVKELSLSFEPLERKEIIILLTKSTIQNEYCSRLDGRISCVAIDRPQKSLLLKVTILNPSITIAEPFLLLFTNTKPRDVFVEIANPGCLEASYKWKKLGQRAEFVSDIDDAYTFARDILSDIFEMLDITEDSDGEFENEMNMSVRYQHYRCRLKKYREDPIGIAEIIDQIIANLDYENRRYHMHFDDDIGDNASLDNSMLYSSETYVRKTVKRMVGMLKLEDSYDVSMASSMECLKDRVVYFEEKEGIIQAAEKRKCLLHCPGVRKGYELFTSFHLDVVGGDTKNFEVVLVNLEEAIHLSKQSIYLGIKPWYELFRTHVKIRNITKYTIKVQFDEIEKLRPHRFRPSEGYAKVRDEKLVYISTFGMYKLRLEGIIGFSDNFYRSISILVNDSDLHEISLRAQGVMPILWVTRKLPRVQQDQLAILEEYQLLQNIYYMDVFRSITEEDDDWLATAEEEARESVHEDSVSLNLSIDSSMMSVRSRDRRFFNLMKTYVLVNNNEELPNAMVLEQLLETERFLKRVRTNADINCLLNMVYRDYVKVMMTHDELMPINLKHFTVQPLPYELNGYVLSMGSLKLHHLRKFEFHLHFFGPGKLIAASRTVVNIPGFVVDFHVDEVTEDKEFIYFKAQHKAPDFFDKPYRNMMEREIDLEEDPKLKHAHSFDLSRQVKHQRKFSAKERKSIENYYNSLNKSVYLEHKHHYVMCKIFTKSKMNFSNVNMRVTIFIKPDSKFYEIGQLIEDYLYIDLHMGPTLPILLKGLIVK